MSTMQLLSSFQVLCNLCYISGTMQPIFYPCTIQPGPLSIAPYHMTHHCSSVAHLFYLRCQASYYSRHYATFLSTDCITCVLRYHFLIIFWYPFLRKSYPVNLGTFPFRFSSFFVMLRLLLSVIGLRSICGYNILLS